MQSAVKTPYNHAQCCTLADLEHLTMPKPIAHGAQDLTIVGGGLAGLLVGKTVAEHVEVLRQRKTSDSEPDPVEMNIPVERMKLLVGGDSLAYSPVRGQLSQLLTLHGSDGNPRAAALDKLRGIVADLFHDLSFEFEPDSRARKVTLGEGRFRVDACERGTRSYFESERVVLALGHTLREPPRELRDYVIRGGGELCGHLAEALTECNSMEQSLERVLERYQTVKEDTIRIGLVGLGPSAFEVLKVLETFLRKPDEYSAKYRTPVSGKPVELVLYDPHLVGSATVYQGLLRLLFERLAIPPEVNVGIKTRESYRRVAERLIAFHESDQLILVPHNLDWAGLKLREGLVVADEKCSSCPQELSLIIDCAPFVEGIGPQQRAIIKDLDIVNLQEFKPNLWKVKDIKPEWQSRLAFAGAAVLPRWRWNADQITAQAQEIFERFYGVSPLLGENSENR
jgi:hypothetical protein